MMDYIYDSNNRCYREIGYGYVPCPYLGELATECQKQKMRMRNKKVITTARMWNENAWGSESIAESLHVSDAITEALRERGELSCYESFSF